jgi:hypothetical protein
MEYVFSKPYEFEGKEYKTIEFDLDSLKGSDIAAAKKQFSNAGNYSAVPAADSEFCALILSRVTKQPLEFFTEMPAKDYCSITQTVSNFLLA